MARSIKGDGSPPSDGRRNNRPPEHGKIKFGEVRNRYGRAGKPKPIPPTSIDRLFCNEADRIVSHDDDGPVDAKRRLVQEEFYDALGKADPAARARVFAQLAESLARVENEDREFDEHVIARKFVLSEDFYFARKTRTRPPDILPHPDHVKISGDSFSINGPIDRAGREAWEILKAAIRIAACLHDIIRTEHRDRPTDITHEELKAIERHRRWLMRHLPKGWNWREEIYCRDSLLDFAKETATSLRSYDYVPSSN